LSTVSSHVSRTAAPSTGSPQSTNPPGIRLGALTDRGPVLLVCRRVLGLAGLGGGHGPYPGIPETERATALTSVQGTGGRTPTVLRDLRKSQRC
jgi:hypothetical protein